MWRVDGKRGGHMCVAYQDNNGKEYILESTSSPNAELIGDYDVYALFNDVYAVATKEGLDLFDIRPIEEALHV
jgi:hypothetical protein